MNLELQAVKSKLDHVVEQGRSELRRWSLYQSVLTTFQHYPQWFFVSACIFFIVSVIGNLTGHSSVLWGFWTGTLAILTFVLVILAATAGVRYWRSSVERSLVLARYDKHLALKDRLQAADQFLAEDASEPFRLAAIDDAYSYTEEALKSSIKEQEADKVPLKLTKWYLLPAALVVLFIATNLYQLSWFNFTADEGLLSNTLQGTILNATPNDETSKKPDAQPAKLTKPYRFEASVVSAGNKKNIQNEQQALSRTSEPPNQTNSAGDSTNAANGSRSASGKGSASTKSQQRKTNNKINNKSPQSAKSSDQGNKGQSAMSGAGNSSNSGSPSSSEENTHLEELSPEADASNNDASDGEDEKDENQEAQGARQSFAPKPKPPVNKKNVGAGLLPGVINEEINDRGGDSGLKKTRGVSSMLLGVPQTDRLLGATHKGNSRIQTEQSKPTVIPAKTVLASDRNKRNKSVGVVRNPSLSTQQQNIVRNYFLNERNISDEVKP